MDILPASVVKPMDGGPSFTLRNRLFRAVWNAAWLIFASWTPRKAHLWRRIILRSFGAQIGKQCDVRGSARVWHPPNLIMEDYTFMAEHVICYNQAPILLREWALVSQGAHLCAGTHDIDDPDFQLVSKPITIGSRAWIAAEAFVGPGVNVGEGAVLGARAVTFSDLDPWGVYIGNPARKLRGRKRT